MKHILLVVWGFEPFGGMEQHVLQLARGLQRADIKVTVLSEMPVAASNFYAHSLREAGVRLLCAPRAVWIANGLWIALHPSKAAKDRLIHGGGPLSLWLRRGLDRMARDGADLVHIHGCRLGQTWVIDWAKARGLPSAYTEHVAITEFGGPLTVEGPNLALTAGVLACVSEHSRKSLESILPHPRPIAITGHIIASPPREPCSPTAGSGRFEILCAARLENHKGIDVLLRAFASLALRRPDAHLTLAGDGSEAADLQRLCRELGVERSVTFAGALPPDRLAQALRQTDVVALPSRSEGLPLSVLEALAAGKPLVATRVGGIPELITHGETGLLADADDPTGLAEALIALAEDPLLRARLGEAGRRMFETSRHHEGRVIPEMLALYREAARA